MQLESVDLGVVELEQLWLLAGRGGGRGGDLCGVFKRAGPAQRVVAGPAGRFAGRERFGGSARDAFAASRIEAVLLSECR